MKRQAPSPDPTFLPTSFAVSGVGTWNYDVTLDRLRYCSVVAELFGLPPEKGSEGVPMERITEATHPEDRARGRAKRLHVFRHGGAFVHEHRVLSPVRIVRWVLVRGFYDLNEAGQAVRGRGIAIDVTAGKEEGFAEGEVLFVTEADDTTVSALDRATRHVLAARRAFTELGPEGEARLRPAADALLMEIAHHLAATMVPVEPSRTEH